MYLYFGDDDMTRAAAYLCGIMTHYELPFERVDSTQSPPDSLGKTSYDVYILSDYPRENFKPEQIEILCEAVKNGAGLVMLGGWESYHGLNGEYHNTKLAEVLPVLMLAEDDRRNFSQGLLLSPVTEHPILAGLPWEHPPLIGGINEFRPKPESQTLLEGQLLNVRFADGKTSEKIDEKYECSVGTKTYPLLVVGKYGKGRTVALATDVAPHWVGGFVDWGKNRITQNLSNGGFVEIGADYAKFFAQLLKWAQAGK